MACGRLRAKVANMQFARRPRTIKRSLKKRVFLLDISRLYFNALLNGIKSNGKMVVVMQVICLDSLKKTTKFTVWTTVLRIDVADGYLPRAASQG
jgi:hypothetical protein